MVYLMHALCAEGDVLGFTAVKVLDALDEGQIVKITPTLPSTVDCQNTTPLNRVSKLGLLHDEGCHNQNTKYFYLRTESSSRDGSNAAIFGTAALAAELIDLWKSARREVSS